jgi:protein-tyrosine phosphatase
MTAGAPSGHVDIDGCFNVRDAGGWGTADGRWMRTGALYRADDPVRITPEGRRAVEELGLKAVVDLRQQNQFDRGPGFVDRAITFHIPLVDRVINTDDPPRIEEPHDIAGLYDDMAERGREPLVDAIETIARFIGDGPVMVHCAAGKDRTGMVVALVQAAIGVGLDDIVAEYALSDVPSQRRRQVMVEHPFPGDPAVARSPAFLWAAPAEAMALFAQRAVEAHGSLTAWPLALGVSPDAVDRLRVALVTDPPEVAGSP